MLDSMTQMPFWFRFHLKKQSCNSEYAHRLPFSQKVQLIDALKELFKGYLTDGKEDINDLNALKNMALKVGLNSESIDEVLQTNAFADEATELLN
jgi:predicted DsbA family dithiol-disulfide isomerase